MKKTFKKGLPCYQFHLIEGFSDLIEHAVFTREGGVSDSSFKSLNISFAVGDDPKNVAENRLRILKALNLEKVISLKQIHGKRVAIVDEAFVYSHAFLENNLEQELVSEAENFDGFVTNQKGIGLMIKVADCQALIFFDPVNKVFGLAHAGWRGLMQDISGEIIGVMQERFGCEPKNILVGISPSLGPENAEFTHPHTELPSAFHPFIRPGNKVDLWEFSKTQLESYGILPNKIELARICTMSDSGKKFFSHRRDKGITGRFPLIAYLK